MATAYSHNTYRKVDVETASQGKLVVMLFNGAIVRAEEAKRAIGANDVPRVHEKLVRAQDIIAELRAALNMNAGEVAENLDRLYEYAYHLLVQANLKKDTECIDNAVEILTSMRNTWQELFEKVESEQAAAVPAAPRINQHGNSVMNLKG